MSDSALRDLAANLVSDVLYGSTKELLRALLAASFTTLLLATRPNSPNSWVRAWHTWRWREILKFISSLALLALCVFFAAERVSERCDFEQPLCGFVPGYRAPPPPPPPPLTQAKVAVRDAANSAITFCRHHPYRVAASFGALFLADLVNLAIVVDRLDPIVRLVSLISSPIKRAAGAVWRLLLRYRVAL